MQSRVKSEQKWQKSRPLIKCTVLWKFAQKVLIKKAGHWSLAYVNERKVTLSGNQSTFNLYQRIGVPIEPLIVIEIAPGTTITAADSGIPAFCLGHGYPGKTIVIRNRGVIRGHGGRGGGAGSGVYGTRGGHGAAGGTALRVSEAQCPVMIENYGHIGGGGGGGGGGGACVVHPSGTFGYQAVGSPGTHGRHGFEGAGPTPASARSRFWANLSGWGRWMTASDPFGLKGQDYRGGRGGAGAAAGGHGRGSLTPCAMGTMFPPGNGGRAGYAIDGISKAHMKHAGTTSGAWVN